LKLYVGCSGWSYDGWLGHFYPSRLENRRWLEYYGGVFDYVEIDSTFYKTPNRNTAVRWAQSTPPNFRFSAKFPQVVTHDTRLGGGLDALEHFFEIMKPLQSKLLCLLMQLPSSLTKKEGLPKLERLAPLLWKKYRYAIEVRHSSWFDKEVYGLLAKYNICLVWSQFDAIQTPPEITTDFVYLRLIGDRSIDEKDFGRVQKDRLAEMEKWAMILKNARRKVAFGIVAANNHYAGFDPSTANGFRKMVGMDQVQWEEMKQGRLL
jgi:uncharacterized protein YecE (DUF72 family)